MIRIRYKRITDTVYESQPMMTKDDVIVLEYNSELLTGRVYSLEHGSVIKTLTATDSTYLKLKLRQELIALGKQFGDDVRRKKLKSVDTDGQSNSSIKNKGLQK